MDSLPADLPPSQEAPPLALFLEAVHRQMGLGLRERLAAERLLRQWGDVHREGELRAAVVSLLACDKESWQQIARLWDAHFPQPRQGKVPKEAEPSAGKIPPIPPERAPGRLLRLGRRIERKAPFSDFPSRHRFAGAVALGLILGLVLGLTLTLFQDRVAAPFDPPLVIWAPPPPPDAEIPPEVRPPSLTPVPIGEEVVSQRFSPPPPGRNLVALLGAVTLALLSMGLYLRALPALVVEERRHSFEDGREKSHADRVALEQRRAAAGLPLELSYRVERFPAVSPQAVVDSAQPLGRLFREQHSDTLDVEATLDRTVRRGGRFSPIHQPRRVRQEVLILVDTEEGDHPWLGPFRRLVAAWVALGVQLRLYEVEGDYSFLEMDPRHLEDEGRAVEILTLGELMRHTEDLPLLLFSRHLDPGARQGESGWLRALRAWPRRAWLDPDPRPASELRPSHRKAIEVFEEAGLRRFPLTDKGVVQLARHLAGSDEKAATERPLAPLPGRREGGEGDARGEALRLWALAGALVPDATWDQLEAIRRHFPEIHNALPDPREIYRLLQWVARELEAPQRDLSQDRILLIPRSLEHRWVLEQRALESHLPPEERFEHRARLLLLDQLASTRPEDPLDAQWWDFKRANHLAVLEPEKAQELLAGFLEGPLALEAAPLIAAELQRQEEAGLQAWSAEDRQALRAGLDQGAALERPLSFRELRLARPGGWRRFLLRATLVSFLLVLCLDLLEPAIRDRFSVKVKSTVANNVLARLEEVTVSKIKAGIEMISIPGGDFLMGSESGDTDERPVHPVTVPDFEMSKTEVTVAQYQIYIETEGLRDPEAPYDSCNWNKEDRSQHPMNCVSWEEAQAFAAWAGGHLPSEAEWEFAARSGGQARKYPWGNEEADCNLAVVESPEGEGCGENRTWEACSKTAGNTDQGLCDMAGNVWEWVADSWVDTYRQAPTDGSAVEKEGASLRVIRGGSWWDVPRYARVALRLGWQPSGRSDFLGFRVARSKPLALGPLDPRQKEEAHTE